MVKSMTKKGSTKSEKSSTFRIKFTDFDEFYKGKHELLYSNERGLKPLTFEGFETTIDLKLKKILDDKKIKYTILSPH